MSAALIARPERALTVSIALVLQVNPPHFQVGTAQDGRGNRRVKADAWEKTKMAAWLQQGTTGWQPPAHLARVQPQDERKTAGLGIPVFADKAFQALTVSSLDPEWEARFEPDRMGSGLDAAVRTRCRRDFRDRRRGEVSTKGVLNADLTAAFDQIDHTRLLAALGIFPGREMVEGWGDGRSRFAPTERGSLKAG